MSATYIKYSEHVSRMRYMIGLIIIIFTCFLSMVGENHRLRKMDFIHPQPVKGVEKKESRVRTKINSVTVKEVEPTKEPIETDKLSSRAQQCASNHPSTVKAIKDWFKDDWVAAVELYCKESSLNHLARNPNGGACGLVQAWPCEKLPCELSDLQCQLKWGHNYITQRYGTASKALAFHIRQEQIRGKGRGWY